MSVAFELNRVRLTMKQMGRQRVERILPCMWCDKTFEAGFKKIKVPNVNWKQWVPAKQFCRLDPCSAKTTNFKIRLQRRLLHPQTRDDYLTAQYCLFKMIKRVPLKYLEPILNEAFGHARPRVFPVNMQTVLRPIDYFVGKEIELVSK